MGLDRSVVVARLGRERFASHGWSHAHVKLHVARTGRHTSGSTAGLCRFQVRFALETPAFAESALSLGGLLFQLHETGSASVETFAEGITFLADSLDLVLESPDPGG